MGAMLPPILPSDATELRLPIAMRAFYQHPVGNSRSASHTSRSPTVSDGILVAH